MGVRDIVSHDPSREIWKQLRLFLSVEGTVERLRRTHKIQKGKYEADLKKQARQIGYCLRQAGVDEHAAGRCAAEVPEPHSRPNDGTKTLHSYVVPDASLRCVPGVGVAGRVIPLMREARLPVRSAPFAFNHLSSV